MFNQQKICQAALWMMPGIGDVLSKQLIAYCGSAEAVFKANYGKLMTVPGIGEKIARDILSYRSFDSAGKLLQECETAGVKAIHFTDAEYPSRLRQLLDSPAFLFLSGNVNFEFRKVVAIVGTRRASEYGRTTTDEIITGLVPHNPLIVSGLAYGIDIQAHKSALRNKLATVGVIAGGVNKLYPAVHWDTARHMMKNGGIVAEFSPETIPEAHQFPERNRIIAGLADLTIVIETARTGGAMITAEYANNYNREVFAVPGNVHLVNSEGCNKLIRNHKAHIFTSVKDIEYIMNWDQAPDKIKTVINEDNLSEPERSIIGVLRVNKNEILIDDLSWKSQVPINRLAGHLLTLELKGIVKSLPGKKYRLLL
jgi:DNA processing protein